MPYAEINGATLYYEIAGAGETVVLLHAGIADHRMWDETFAALAQQYRVLRYDLRGFGLTTAPAAPFSHHEDLHGLLTQLGIERTALVGCSNGGRVAVNFLLTYPAMALALAMVCSAPGGFNIEGEDPPLYNELVAAFKAGDLELTSKLETQFWLVGVRRTPDQVDQKLRDLVYEMNLIALRNEVAGKGEEQPFAPPAVERLGEVHVPTLAIIGALDEPYTHEAANFMTEQIAGARQVMIENTAHLPSMERPDEFNGILMGFLQDVLKK